jgi:eukaryotic-like serine/threonine-protein kinase
MLPTNQCPQCHAPIDLDSPEGICTRCLLAGCLERSDWGSSEDRLIREILDDVFLRRYGDYEITREIGRGGMGMVYLARQISLNRTVALKLILAGPLARPEQLARFEIEVDVATHLEHPNILPIYEIGECEGQYFFSMKYINGSSLADNLAELSKSPRDFAQILVKVARAVSCAHGHGILHLDIKPSNILLDQEREPYLIDFGLARMCSAQHPGKATRVLCGTPRYMSPEQAAGDPELFTMATDVYGIGVLLYELLTGRTPFVASHTSETLRRIRYWPPRSPSRLNPAIDNDLERICLKCIHKDPANRYRTADVLADELEGWLHTSARHLGKSSALLP